jgi:hypothetical protein
MLEKANESIRTDVFVQKFLSLCENQADFVLFGVDEHFEETAQTHHLI